MTTLSINLPETLAKASQEAASKMGITRTEFIRQAVLHELKHFQATLEEEGIVSSIMAMKESKSYRKGADDLIDGFSSDLPKDKNKWWQKKKS